jgi:hypothetical protein
MLPPRDEALMLQEGPGSKTVSKAMDGRPHYIFRFATFEIIESGDLGALLQGMLCPWQQGELQ